MSRTNWYYGGHWPPSKTHWATVLINKNKTNRTLISVSLWPGHYDQVSLTLYIDHHWPHTLTHIPVTKESLWHGPLSRHWFQCHYDQLILSYRGHWPPSKHTDHRYLVSPSIRSYCDADHCPDIDFSVITTSSSWPIEDTDHRPNTLTIGSWCPSQSGYWPLSRHWFHCHHGPLSPTL